MTPMIPHITKKPILEKVDGYDDQEPYAIFIKNEGINTHKYTVRIIAFIPCDVEDTFEIDLSDGKKEIKTPFGGLSMRTIYLRWKMVIRPENAPHKLWSITVQYTPSGTKEENGIRVKYKFGGQGPVKPRTPRGTVTTSSDPCE